MDHIGALGSNETQSITWAHESVARTWDLSLSPWAADLSKKCLQFENMHGNAAMHAHPDNADNA